MPRSLTLFSLSSPRSISLSVFGASLYQPYLLYPSIPSTVCLLSITALSPLPGGLKPVMNLPNSNRQKILSWVQPYLTGTFQKVYVNGMLDSP